MKDSANSAFGTVSHALQRHLERFRRHSPVTVLSRLRVRSTLPDAGLDKPPTRTEDALVIVLPVGRSISDWPSGNAERLLRGAYVMIALATIAVPFFLSGRGLRELRK